MAECRACLKDIGSVRSKRRFYRYYCNPACERQWRQRQYREKNPHRLDLPTGTVGARLELLVAADLMARKYHVFRALSPNCPCDLAVLKDGVLLRVEVRAAFRSSNGHLNYSKRSTGNVDVWALGLADGEIAYEPMLP